MLLCCHRHGRSPLPAGALLSLHARAAMTAECMLPRHAASAGSSALLLLLLHSHVSLLPSFTSLLSSLCLLPSAVAAAADTDHNPHHHFDLSPLLSILQTLSVELLLLKTQAFPLVFLLSSLSALFPLLSSLCSLPSSLAAAHCSDRSSHMSLRTLHQAIEPAPSCLDPVRHHPWPGGMREAIK